MQHFILSSGYHHHCEHSHDDDRRMQNPSFANLWSSERFYEGELEYSKGIFQRSILE